ncbi:hypothetical protein AB6A40_005107 [Gnathostoma spinigerum]|uniref:Uncharacterized protein n=1 Tax=Gnathostoma spinigerum TaxID=75299 RepID=A0ABD6EEH7_9BILA
MFRHVLLLTALHFFHFTTGSSIRPASVAHFTSSPAGTGTVPSSEEDDDYDFYEYQEKDYDDDWYCGTDPVSKSISQHSIEQSCPELKDAVNNCCFNHDNCYDEQLGRSFCDQTFCSCLQNATKDNEICRTRESQLFCNLVIAFGEGAYASSRKMSEKDQSRSVKHDGKKEVDVNKTTTGNSSDRIMKLSHLQTVTRKQANTPRPTPRILPKEVEKTS